MKINEIEEEIKYCVANKLCCMCHSSHIISVDPKTEEYLCQECNDINNEVYGLN